MIGRMPGKGPKPSSETMPEEAEAPIRCESARGKAPIDERAHPPGERRRWPV